jgi:hypothetical protein
MPASRAWRTRAAAGKEQGAGRGDGAGRRRWAGSRAAEVGGELGLRSRMSRGGGAVGRRRGVLVGVFCATRIPSAQAADSLVVVYVAGAHEFAGGK